MKIVFMGTPDFAVPSLKALVEAGYDVQQWLLSRINQKEGGNPYFLHL